MPIASGLRSTVPVLRFPRLPEPVRAVVRAPWRAISIVATILQLWVGQPATAPASWQGFWLQMGGLNYGSEVVVRDNDPLDLDPEVDSIRIGGPLGTPLLVAGYEVSLWGRSYRRDGVQYVTLSEVLLSGAGAGIRLELTWGHTLPAVMFGYASHWSTARFVEPMQPDNHALVYSSGGLAHNVIDTHFPNRATGSIDGIPGADSIVFNPQEEYAYWFYGSYWQDYPEYRIWTEMVFHELRTDLPNHIQFESEMKVRFAPWVPEPTSSVIWSAFGLAGLSLRGKRNSLRSVPAL